MLRHLNLHEFCFSNLHLTIYYDLRQMTFLLFGPWLDAVVLSTVLILQYLMPY